MNDQQTHPMPPPHIGRVALAVADLDRSVSFYREVIGLREFSREGDVALMGAGDTHLLLLHGQQNISRVRRATGLYHFALLLPSRADLGDTLAHLIAVQGPISGYADHAVSEAIYLTDPDGHGIEIYRDRPREQWTYPNGTLKMTVDPIDFEGVLEARTGQWRGLPDGTMMGHIHLQVASIPATEQFYIDLLGFDLVTRYGSGASFLSANGYHHHFGTNTWAGTGLPPAPEDAARLLWYEIRQPDASALEAIAGRLGAGGYPFEHGDRQLHVVDPSGIHIRLTTDDVVSQS